MEACAEKTGTPSLPIASRMEPSDAIQSDAPRSSLASAMAIGKALLQLALSAHTCNLNALRETTTTTRATTRSATSSGETSTSFAGMINMKAIHTSMSTAKAPLMTTKLRSQLFSSSLHQTLKPNKLQAVVILTASASPLEAVSPCSLPSHILPRARPRLPSSIAVRSRD